MHWDLDKVVEPIAYKLLAATVMPRPIAWVVTQSAKGALNAAPYSFFNVMGSAPPTITLGLMADPKRGFKDTAANILATGEFVVNLVPEALVQQMNTTSVDAPTGVNELDLADLATTPSLHIRPPRIAASPVAFECAMLSSVITGPHQTIVIGRVLAVHIDDRFILNAERAHIDTPALGLVARGYGSTYVRSHETFELDRPKWADWPKQTPR
ncbi:flavin reductase family protein [Cypionkella sinensis]|uniref:Flavin reductase family protein n=1 Tax=Cypionkella sinensis TaxID=1756043 RepID=A0ABV7J4T9_9RHOB